MADLKDPSDEKPSKSQLKREMTSLQKLGETLIALSETQLAQIPLPDNLLQAIQFAHTLKTHESIRRHLQYIGKIMRHLDPAPILKALKIMQAVHDKTISALHLTEQWRDQLLKEGDDGIQKILALYPQMDRQKLRQLVRKAQHDQANGKDTGGAIELFRYLRDCLA